MSRTHQVLILLLPAIGLIGCGEPPTIQQYEISSETEPQFTSELLRREFPPIPFHWEIPQQWTLASNDQFSVRAWSAGPPTAQARVTVGQFPARTGIPAQVMRWRRQLGLKSDDPDEAMKAVKSLKTKNRAGSFATVEGASETILAFVLPIDSQFWIFRFRGPNATTKTEGDGFRAFCESLEYVAPAAESSTKDQPAMKQDPTVPTSPSSANDSPPESTSEDSEPAPTDDTKETESPATPVDSAAPEDKATDEKTPAEDQPAADDAPSDSAPPESTPSESTPPSETSDAAPADDATPEGDE